MLFSILIYVHYSSSRYILLNVVIFLLLKVVISCIHTRSVFYSSSKDVDGAVILLRSEVGSRTCLFD